MSEFLSKHEIVERVAVLLEVSPPVLSTGSTEPKSIFIAINDQLGLGLKASLSKAAMGRGIVEASGARWLPDFESRGGTVTRKGLQAVLEAVEYFLRP